MNKEVYHEGWLIKSPPTKRIWRARWRKRWFTLKQGEIPGQFCLEYYTDRNCRKLKGVIDLDQCEQVDSGLRLEHRKQKFQFMFDIKTPRRTYYLAAETETDMRDWVNCICQVCNLYDFTKQSGGDRQYYNVCDNDTSVTSTSSNTLTKQKQEYDLLNDNTTLSTNSNITTTVNTKSQPSVSRLEINSRIDELSLNNTSLQNNEFQYVNTNYSNRETISCDHSLQNHDKNKTSIDNRVQQDGAKMNESIPSLDRSQSLKKISKNGNDGELPISPNHIRAQSLNETGIGTRTGTTEAVTKKKIPENLVLSNTFVESSVEPSPALSTCSGPYIPISECFSGSPKILNNEVPCTPLNNLDPKFYDTPRSHNNIGLNLTNDTSYSPKIYNCPETQVKHRSGRSTPSDSESVFTDDEEWPHSVPLRENIDRNLRPSDSSVENDAIVFTYSQRFSKIPDGTQTDDKKSHTDENKISKRRNLALESTSDEEKLCDKPQLSDTENTSPPIGPRDSSSCVEESYDIPRSHHLPYYNMNSLQQEISPDNPSISSSTPDLIAETELSKRRSTQTLSRPHFYTNAAPTKVEGNVFRYDFIEQSDVPPVNRNLKPKLCGENKPAADVPSKQIITRTSINSPNIDKSTAQPPSVDRKLKPSALKRIDSPITSSTLRRPGIPASFIASTDSEFNVNHKELETRTLPRNISSTFSSTNNSAFESISSPSFITKSNNSQLQYFDLDTSNPPPPPPQINRANSSVSSNQTVNNGGNNLKLGTSLESGVRTSAKSGVVYNSVDFLKTEAFKRIREDAEKNRMKD